MINTSFDVEALRQIIREEVRGVMSEKLQTNTLPPLLTRTELMELLHIGPTKAAELMARPDFPVMREAGVLIPTDKLFQWIDRHTRWVEDNTGFYKVG
ncbi:DNA-binding protein [Sporosarcina sp. Marseille-Q4943]|uniref:DNA-binding protein n=1 Tax=Sporosarcina sp. Marseille-Q4943 TaxID=2942204 RepID=UPI00208DC3FA|nr:DNA-binding protein [Sporosarcina sp. Marseille-Q4943]